MRHSDDKWSDYIMNENIEKRKTTLSFQNLNA